MALTDVGTIDIAGVPCIIQAMASKYGGTWYIKAASDDADLGSGETFDQAKQRARTAIAKRKVKVEVKFRTVAGEHGVATGFHARNRTVLARLDGQAAELNHGDIRRCLAAETPETVIDRLGEIHEQMNALASEQSTLINEWSFKVDQAVREAIDAKVAEAVDAPA